MTRIEQLIFEQAERNPEAIAVECDGERLTYRQLKTEALLISRGLQNLGLQAGGKVVIFQERSPETFPLILGIWNAGGVVVPINPNAPVKLLEWMIQSSSPSIIVTEGALKDRTVAAVDVINSKPVILEDAPSGNGTPSKVKQSPVLDQEPEDDDACYIIFTSGSQGRPKGVRGSHRSLLHYLQWHAKEFSVTENDRFSQIAPLSFDFSLKEFLVPLICGACVCIAGPNTVINPREFVEWAAKSRLTVMCCVPTLLRSILELPDDDQMHRAFQHLRSLLISGEMLRWDDVKSWRNRFGSSVSLFDLYGPTESTVIKLCYPIPEEQCPGSVNVPVGRPIAGTQVLILDERDRSCEDGETGEIVIISEWLARGYINQDAAHSSFCRMDWNGKSERAYRTGDLGRWLPSGDLELMGRKDRQVKVRGFRVELDELESVISEHPSLRDVAVVTCASSNSVDDDGRALIGCYFTCNGSEITEKQVREFAHDRMLPQVLSLTRFSRMDQLPLTANGKVNRRQLEALFEASETRVVYPVQSSQSTTVRQQIHAMWLELLTVEDVGLEANFFEVGGDSILAIRLLRRLREELHPEINLGDVYEFPTVSQLSARVSQLIA